jgi:5-dehydro-2-deoxygluconokinase
VSSESVPHETSCRRRSPSVRSIRPTISHHLYRHPKAPDMEIRPRSSTVTRSPPPSCSGSPPQGSPTSRAGRRTTKPSDSRRRGLPVLDLDYREVFWDGPEQARREVGRGAPHVDVTVATRGVRAVGEDDPVRAADALLERGPTTAVVARSGSARLTPTAWSRSHRSRSTWSTVSAPGTPSAAHCAMASPGRLAARRDPDVCQHGGAIVASRLECSTAMPFTDEVVAAMAGR